MKIGGHNEEQLIVKVIEALCDPSSRASWTLVVPPGFGETYVPNEIKRRLEDAPAPKPRVALIPADRIQRKADWLARLWEQWHDRPDLDVPEVFPSETAGLGDVLTHYRDNRKKIQIISRFHRILDWVDETILQDMRDAEQAHKIQTVVVSMYPLHWIKNQWRKKGRALLASDYGVEHSLREMEALTTAELIQQFRVHEQQAIPPDIIRQVIGWTGGYPELMHAVLKEWVDRNGSELSVPLRQRLFRTAIENARRMADAIDSDADSKFRDLVVDMHLHADTDTTREKLRRVHPWGCVLLDEVGLRADAVGEACLELAMQDALRASAADDPLTSHYANCLSMYRKRQYEQASALLGEQSSPSDPLPLQLLQHHARIMRDYILDTSTARAVALPECRNRTAIIPHSIGPCGATCIVTPERGCMPGYE